MYVSVILISLLHFIIYDPVVGNTAQLGMLLLFGRCVLLSQQYLRWLNSVAMRKLLEHYTRGYVPITALPGMAIVLAIGLIAP
jgi:hypothetical protein